MEALDYRTPPRPPQAPAPLGIDGVWAAIGFSLSMASFLVVLKGAGDEPYMAYRESDEWVQVGVGIALIVLWCVLALVTIALVAARKLLAGWLILLPWAAVCVFYLNEGRAAYLSDIERFVPAASRQ